MRLSRNLIFLLLLFFNFNLFSKQLKLVVVDKDIAMPLEGVEVKLYEQNQKYTTDADGKIIISLPDDTKRVLIGCYLIGYTQKKMAVTEFDKDVTVELLIEGMLEGKELVIEQSYYTKEQKVGTSMVIDKEELKSLSMRGRMEDVMNAIRTLPGVSYSAGFYTQLSVRGGSPQEISASYDGFIVRVPYYWGSAHSIFDPHIVESAKFNNGAFSAKYGMAMSGLLEITTKTPNEGFKFEINQSMSSFDAYFNIPFSRKAGLLIGGRVTYIDLTMGLVWKLQGIDMVRAPYIYDANIKFFYKPTDRFEWYINGFFGNDGLHNYQTVEDKDNKISTKYGSYNENFHPITTTGFKILPNDKVYIHCFAGYEYYLQMYNFTEQPRGTRNYSSNFMNSPLSAGITKNSFNITDLLDSKSNGNFGYHSIQTRCDVDVTLHDKVLFSFGGGLIYDIQSYLNNYSFYNSQTMQRENTVLEINNSHQLNSSAYVNFKFIPIPKKLEIELGARVDHFVSFYGTSILNTYPVANPRFYLSYTPIRDKKYLEYFTISFGTGLYSKTPNIYFAKDNKHKFNDIQQEKLFSTIIGAETMFDFGLNIKLESYFKYYFHRNYKNKVIIGNDAEWRQYSDGQGFAAGFDIIIKQKISRYIDGWASYSFVFGYFNNPSTDGLTESDDGQPVGRWFYPSYHRWHSFNLVLNIKPVTFLTISPSIGIHSGLPQKQFTGDTVMYRIDTPQDALELYYRKKEYSDTARTYPSVPINFKIAFHHYFPRTQVKMEIYFAMDNILSMAIDKGGKNLEPIYSPDQEIVIDKYTGNEMNKFTPAYESFLPSFGIKVSY